MNNKTVKQKSSTKTDICQKFVREPLLNLISSANEKIVDCYYEVNSIGEFVMVQVENGAVYNINVTGDSLMAIAKDVITYMMYR